MDHVYKGGVEYDFEIDRIVSEIKRLNARKVLIQMPDGLKSYSIYIRDQILSKITDVEIIFSGSSAWGACLLDDLEAEAEGYDLLIHIGHVEYSYYKPRYRTLFIPAYYVKDISNKAIEEAIEILKSRKARNIAIYSTIQHVRTLKKVAESLSARFKVVNYTAITTNPNNQALVGCDYMKPYSIRNYVDSYVFIAGGIFHPLGLGLTIPFKPIVKIDPYEDKAQDLTSYIEKKIRKRIYKIHEAKDAKNWAIIDGVKGQNRAWFREYLKKLIAEKGGKYIEYISLIIDRNLIMNIDNSWIDAFIILACPRIPTDDLEDYHKPILTPTEARMVLTNRLDSYTFPW